MAGGASSLWLAPHQQWGPGLVPDGLAWLSLLPGPPRRVCPSCPEGTRWRGAAKPMAGLRASGRRPALCAVQVHFALLAGHDVLLQPAQRQALGWGEGYFWGSGALFIQRGSTLGGGGSSQVTLFVSCRGSQQTPAQGSTDIKLGRLYQSPGRARKSQCFKECQRRRRRMSESRKECVILSFKRLVFG